MPEQKRIAAIHQPNFFPWLGYFRKMARADVFILLDDAQFQKTGGNWSNRVRIARNGEAVWWSAPVLVLAAIENAALEEVIMVGYLFTRWRQSGWSWPLVIGLSALIRGSYHLYQGFGGFAGNIVMGLVLGLVFVRTRRVMPLVVCHALLDTVAFVGYSVLRARGVSI